MELGSKDRGRGQIMERERERLRIEGGGRSWRERERDSLIILYSHIIKHISPISAYPLLGSGFCS